MKMVAKLRLVRSVVERGWCQLDNAVDADSEPCRVDDAAAVCWCLNGAALRVAIGITPERTSAQEAANEIVEALSAATIRYYDMAVIHWNDDAGRTQADVLAFMDRIIGEYEPVPVFTPGFEQVNDGVGDDDLTG